MEVRGLVCLVIALLLCAFGGVANAATRYAGPAGGTSGECISPFARCTLSRALTQAQAGDEVVIGTGTYSTTSEVASSAASVSIHGEFDQPMPRIVYSGPFSTGVAFNLKGNSDSLAWAEIVSEAAGEAPLACRQFAVVQRVRAIAIANSSSAMFVEKTCDVVDTLAVAEGSSSSGMLVGTGSGGSMTIRNSTAVGLGAGSRGIEVKTIEGEPAAVAEVSNTIAFGAFADLLSNGKASTLAVEHSNFDGSVSSEGGVIINAGNNQAAPPLFVNAAIGDFAEAVGSPTIDAGAILPEYITPTLDLPGNPRIVNGAIDIGAFEFFPPPSPPAPVVALPPVAGPPSATVVLSSLKISPKAFRVAGAGGAKKSAARGATVTFSLSAPATVSFEIERKGTGRKVGGHCVGQNKGNAGKPKCVRYKPIKGTFTKDGKRGSNSFAFNGRVGGKTLTAGSYSLIGAVGKSTAQAGFTILE